MTGSRSSNSNPRQFYIPTAIERAADTYIKRGYYMTFSGFVRTAILNELKSISDFERQQYKAEKSEN